MKIVIAAIDLYTEDKLSECSNFGTGSGTCCKEIYCK